MARDVVLKTALGLMKSKTGVLIKSTILVSMVKIQLIAHHTFGH
jgi:hypothetical protein